MAPTPTPDPAPDGPDTWTPPDLSGTVALVAGATRGGGRGVATELGAAGATVVCTGRSVRGAPSDLGRDETIEGTAERVTAAGGRGVAVRVDHTDELQVRALMERIRADHGRLHLLVNGVWGGDALTDWTSPLWEQDLAAGRTLLERAVWSHLVTARHGIPLLLDAVDGPRPPLLIEVTDGDGSTYRGTLFYDLAKMAAIRLGFALHEELKARGAVALALTPGFLRSEAMLEHFGVTSESWRDAVAQDPYFAESETPRYLGRAVAALAADPEVTARGGKAWATWTLRDAYGLIDVDGRRPHWGEFFARMQAQEE